MTEQVRIDFLNWRPDQEDLGNDGLTVANNVVHDSEGYKPIYLASTGAFSTTGALASVSSIVTKPAGAQMTPFSAWLSADTIGVGFNGVSAVQAGATTTAFATTGATQVITAFDVAELNGQMVFVVEAQQNEGSPDTLTSIGLAGLITVTSVS